MLWNIKSSLTKNNPQARLKEIVQILLANRDFPEKDLDQFLKAPLPSRDQLFKQLPDLDLRQLKTATDVIQQAISHKKPILIYGDYDCDGVCASAILFEALQKLGASVSVFIPHRLEHGYGLSQKGIDTALNSSPSYPYSLTPKPLIVTVDNGITAHQVTRDLRSQDLDIIITDHHQIADSLPGATAIVHTTHLSGSGVAWMLGSILNQKLLPLDLVALGTVCDLLPLNGVNRTLVKHGLSQLKHPSPGLSALYQSAGISPESDLSTYHLGYIIGPRINAVGRLGHAFDAFKLLTTRSTNEAISLSQALSTVNQDRQDLTTDLSQIAIDHFSSLSALPKILFLADQRFHEGIIGLIASKLVERFHRPAIAAAFSEQMVKASARSVPGLDITTFLRQAESLFLSLGGHHQAAGFSLDPQKLSSFEDHLKQSDHLIPDDLLIKKLDIDLQLSLQDLSFDLLEVLDQLAPFGVGNPIPVFCTNLPLKETKTLGSSGKHLKFLLPHPHQHLDVIGFNLAHLLPQISPQSTAKAAFTFQKNTYRSHTKPQLIIKDLKLE